MRRRWEGGGAGVSHLYTPPHHRTLRARILFQFQTLSLSFTVFLARCQEVFPDADKHKDSYHCLQMTWERGRKLSAVEDTERDAGRHRPSLPSGYTENHLRYWRIRFSCCVTGKMKISAFAETTGPKQLSSSDRREMCKEKKDTSGKWLSLMPSSDSWRATVAY